MLLNYLKYCFLLNNNNLYKWKVTIINYYTYCFTSITQEVGLLPTLELICLWTYLLKQTGWQIKLLGLGMTIKEWLQLTTLLADSLT